MEDTRFQRPDEFKAGISADRSTQERKDESESIRKQKRNNKLSKRRGINKDPNEDPFAKHHVTRDVFVDMVNRLDFNLIVNAKTVQDCYNQVDMLLKIILYMDNHPIGEYLTQFIVPQQNQAHIHPNVAGRFVSCLRGTLGKLMQMIHCAQTTQNRDFQHMIFVILARLSFNAEQCVWTNVLMQHNFANILLLHLNNTQDPVTRNYCLVILGNIAMDSTQHRDILLSKWDVLCIVIRKNVATLPRNTIWALSTLFYRQPCPPVRVAKQVWDIIKVSIEQTYCEEKMPMAQQEWTIAGLNCIKLSLRNNDPDVCFPYIEAVLQDEMMMSKLFYFCKHEGTPTDILAMTVDILRLLTKHHGKMPHLIHLGFIPLMCRVGVHVDRDVRANALYALTQLAMYPEFTQSVVNPEVMALIWGRVQYETGLPKWYAGKLLAQILLTTLSRGQQDITQLVMTCNVTHVSAVYILCQIVNDIHVEEHVLVRVLNALQMLLKSDLYRGLVTVGIEESDTDDVLQQRYNDAPQGGLSKQLESILDALETKEEEKDESLFNSNISMSMSMDMSQSQGEYNF